MDIKDLEITRTAKAVGQTQVWFNVQSIVEAKCDMTNQSELNAVLKALCEEVEAYSSAGDVCVARHDTTVEGSPISLVLVTKDAPVAKREEFATLAEEVGNDTEGSGLSAEENLDALLFEKQAYIDSQK